MTIARRLLRGFWFALLGIVAAVPAAAHKPSDSYLSLTVTDGRLSGRWDIALRDLEFAIGLDADGDGAITWGELRARHAEIATYALARLTVLADGGACRLEAGSQQVDEHTDGAYTVVPLAITCPRVPEKLTLRYTLFADIDPQHRGLLNLTVNGATRTAVLVPAADAPTFDLARTDAWNQFVDFVREGVWHIWIGFDHILFLLSLLLPAVLVWHEPAGPPQGRVPEGAARRYPGSRAWRPAPTFRESFWDVVRIVTAFTVAHSITLTMATLGVVTLPSRWVESAIAASVVLAALNNVRPFVQERRWVVAFGFGLIHGFGFASVLADLGLPRQALALALVGFNLGVELGQLAIVVLFLPLAFALRRTALYRRWVMLGGSLLIALLAGVWFVERAFDLKLLPA